MQSLSNYNYRQGTTAGWISYAGKLRDQAPAASAAEAATDASPNYETPSSTHGQISNPALDGRAAAAGEH